MKRLINRLFWPFIRREHRLNVVDVISRHSHGNVRIQTGRFLTIEDCAEMKRKNRAYAF